MLYVLYGENEIEIDKYIKKLQKENNIETTVTYNYKETTITDVLEECSYTDLFGNNKLVVLSDSDFLTGKSTLEDDNLNKYIENPNPNIILIFKVVTDKLDERKKLVKLVKTKSKVLEFPLLNEKTINAYITNYFKENNYKINNESIMEIKSRLLPNPKVVDSELEKLLLYKINEKEINITDVKKVITKYEETNIFKLVDAVIKKDKKNIFTLYKKLKEEKEEPVILLTLLANNFRLILQVQILIEKGYDKYKIASTLKEHPYRIELSINNSFNIEREELKRIIKKLGKIDYNIKTGYIDKYKSLEEFFLEL